MGLPGIGKTQWGVDTNARTKRVPVVVRPVPRWELSKRQVRSCEWAHKKRPHHCENAPRAVCPHCTANGRSFWLAWRGSKTPNDVIDSRKRQRIFGKVSLLHLRHLRFRIASIGSVITAPILPSAARATATPALQSPMTNRIPAFSRAS